MQIQIVFRLCCEQLTIGMLCMAMIPPLVSLCFRALGTEFSDNLESYAPVSYTHLCVLHVIL